MRIYLDNCCFNRPYDDQRQEKVAIETQAILLIQGLVINKKVDLVWSYVLEFENDQNHDNAKRSAIGDWRKRASILVPPDEQILLTASKIIKNGIKEFDALHVASAIYAKCNYFITVDKRLLKFQDDQVKVCNPLEFVAFYEEDEI